MEYKDYPKLESLFVREKINGEYIVTDEINDNAQWVFGDGVRAVDKLNGTNIAVLMEGGKIKKVWNRKNEKDVYDIMNKWNAMAMEGILKAAQKGWLKEGLQYGELIGEKINGNEHKLHGHLFVPFEYLVSKCHWRSWIKNQYPKDYSSISEWFKELPSLFNMKMKLPEIKTEGLVFYHPTDNNRKIKLRRDMFDWYTGRRH